MTLAPDRNTGPTRLASGHNVHQALTLAYARHAAGQFDEAASIGRMILQQSPLNAAALHLVGEVALRHGDHATAIDLVGQAVKVEPRFAEAHNTLGVALKISGRLDEAMQHFRTTLSLKPHFALAHAHLGETLFSIGQLDEAIRHLQEATRLDSTNAEAFMRLGIALMQANRAEEARRAFSRVVELRPKSAAALSNLGYALVMLERGEEAVAVLETALSLDPNLAVAHTNRGLALSLLDRFDEAVAAHRRAAALNPISPDAHLNLGTALLQNGDLDAAIDSFRRAAQMNPQSAMIHSSLAGALLQSGRFAEGWAAYEHVWQHPCNAPARTRHALPFWDGDPLAGRRLLVWNEQGIGDILLFATVLPDLLATGADLVLEVDPRLAPLFARSFPQAVVIPWGAPPPVCDLQINLGRLSRFLRASAAAFSGTRPYLVPDPARVTDFKRRYSALGPGPKIGISWRSNSPSHRRKSLLLDAFAPLFAALPEAVFVSLQYGDTSEERAAFEQRFGVRLIHDASFDNWTDLDGLAAQVAALDRVVTVSNVNAHFAGAQGIPTHVLVAVNSPWYWLYGQTRTPWYGSTALVPVPDRRAPLPWDRMLREMQVRP